MKGRLFLLLVAVLSPAFAGLHDDPATAVDRAAARFAAGDYRDTVAILEPTLEALRRLHGEQAAVLVVPMGYLGSAYLQLGRPAEAVEQLSGARAITHRVDGPDNSRQLPLLHVEAEALAALGRDREAEARYRQAMDLASAEHGPDSLAASLELGRLAQWKADQGDHDRALILFSRAIDSAQEALGGRDAPEMLDLLQGMALVFLDEGFVPGRALPLVERVVAIADDPEAGFDADTRIQAHLLFGDMLMRFSLEAQAIDAYRQAWQIAESAADQGWLDRLANPDAVAGRLKPVDRRPSEGPYFVMRFDLRDDGRPVRVRMLETNADPMVSRWALQRIREVRFRPPMSAGQPQPMKAQTRVFVY